MGPLFIDSLGVFSKQSKYVLFCGGATVMEAAVASSKVYLLRPCFLGHMHTVCF